MGIYRIFRVLKERKKKTATAAAATATGVGMARHGGFEPSTV